MIILVHEGPDLDEWANHLFKYKSDIQNSNINIANDDTILKDIATDFGNWGNTGEPVSCTLSDSKLFGKKPITREQLIKKLELYPIPDNLEALQIKKMQSRNLECNNSGSYSLKRLRYFSLVFWRESLREKYIFLEFY